MNELGNLNIVGVSSVSGGRYHKVKIMGELSVLNDLEAYEISVLGSMDSNHAIKCDKIRVMGTAAMGSLKADRSGAVLGALSASDITAEDFDIKGEVLCRNAFECSSLKVSGAVEVDGLLNAETLSIRSRDVSRVKEMGGRSVKVSPSLPFIKRVLKVQLIEFDEADLDCTEAELVRGRNVIIGEHCRIDVVEYTDNLIRHPNAQIGEVRKV